MNDHSQASEHVVDKNLQPRVTQPRRGHFAKKSTGNNLRHTVSGLKGGPAGKSGQQHSKHNVSSTAKKSIPNSLDNVNQAGSTQRARNLSSVQSEDFRIAKGVSKRDDDTSERSQTLKETKKGKASDAGRKHAQERQNVTERVVNKRSDSSVHPSKDSLKKERVNFEVAKDLKKGKHNVGNKENHLKLKDVQITKEHPSSKASLKQKMEPTVFSSKEQTAISKQLKVTSAASSGSSRERTITDGNEIECVSNLEQTDQKVAGEKASSTKTVGVSHDINKLQPEDISSDEDFETSQDPHVVSSSKVASNIPSTGDVFFSKAKQSSKLSIKIPEAKLTPSKDNFLVVDEVGFTPDESNSSQSVSSSEVGHTQSPNASNKLVEEIAASKPKSSLVQISDDVLGTFDLPENKCALPVASQEEKDAEMRQRQAAVEVKVFAKEGNPLNVSTRVKVANTHTTFTQTEDQVEKKDVAIETMSLKPDMKDQSVQFSSITNDIDPESCRKSNLLQRVDILVLGALNRFKWLLSASRGQQVISKFGLILCFILDDLAEITPIVTAMFESECEEKERLKKALDEKIGKEEKWRNMVKDLCRQLRELRQQLEKKEPHHLFCPDPYTMQNSYTLSSNTLKGWHTHQDREPEKHARNASVNTFSETSALPVIISTQATQTEKCESPAISCTVSAKPYQESTEGHAIAIDENTGKQGTSSAVSSAANSNLHEPMKTQTVASPSSQVISEKETDLSVANGAVNLTKPVQSQSLHTAMTNGTQVTEQSSEATEVIDLTDSEDPSESTIQVKKSPVQSISPLKLVANHRGLQTSGHNSQPVLSKPNILQVNSKSLAIDQPQANIRPVVSQAGIPQVPSLRSLQPEKTMPAIIRTSLPSVQNMQRSMPHRQMQNQFPVTSVNRTSAAPVITQLVATQFNTMDLHHCNNSKLKTVFSLKSSNEECYSLASQLIKDLLALFTWWFPPGDSFTIKATPSPSQVQSTLQEKKGTMLDDKRDGLSRQFQQTYQLSNAQKQVGKTPQLKSGLNEMEGSEKVQMQTFRNFKVSAPSEMVSQEKGPLLPSPSIRISHSPEGVVLSWNITTTQDHPTVKKYFLYAYQVLNTPPSTSHWKRIGEVGALPPPMACTLNQFQPGSTYFLAICAVDVYDRPGYFSKTEEVVIPRS
ncbi:putative activating transcription factor 7-interacting protein 1 isoform X1 [Apostichopus japonicus]|uniref:Putative activating transcription factor 7-interacting protein 1 isoform X1 n=1 Tax=Stichopus japonicus TaxID=307972 RepID=A0A2G8LHJ3_STIJA|nr:putative activating transcription factor 7-interacting protein 1 isoform X1 [Apostichopus japonicus]